MEGRALPSVLSVRDRGAAASMRSGPLGGVCSIDDAHLSILSIYQCPWMGHRSQRLLTIEGAVAGQRRGSMSCAPDTLKAECHDEDRHKEAFATEEGAPATRQLNNLERCESGASKPTHHAMRLPAKPEGDQAPLACGGGGSQGEAETRPQRQCRSCCYAHRHPREVHPLPDALRRHSISSRLARVSAMRRGSGQTRGR